MSRESTIVIFGASGDLSQRKLIPALFNLYRKGRLPERFTVLGLATRPWDDQAFRTAMRAALDEHADYAFQETEWDQFAPRLHYRSSNFSDPATYELLKSTLTELESRSTDRLYYLATSPEFFMSIISGLGQNNLTIQEMGRRCVVIEKPFGVDLTSARALNMAVHQYIDEGQVYRIDHYLGKETVQNLLVFRFANTIFEPIWNRNYIDHVQITVAEEIGVGHRGGYYDEAGVLRDMFQNHLLQLLTLTAMEPPATYKAESLRDEKVKVLNTIRPMTPDQIIDSTVRGQYRGYRDEPKVAPDSQTETFGAVRLYIDNWRWQGVPFYLRSGKCLPEKRSEVIVRFNCPPHQMFPLPASKELNANILAICLQPDEGIHLQFDAKVPDTVAEMQPVLMDFHYRDSFGPTAIPEAYERLLLDAIHGDTSLFIRDDQAELAWEFIDPILDTWLKKDALPLEIYETGSWGPKEADAFIARDGRAWLRSCGGH
jgi:glucose-6-phosphate 1-dehydrogenase